MQDELLSSKENAKFELRRGVNQILILKLVEVPLNQARAAKSWSWLGSYRSGTQNYQGLLLRNYRSETLTASVFNNLNVINCTKLIGFTVLEQEKFVLLPFRQATIPPRMLCSLPFIIIDSIMINFPS